MITCENTKTIYDLVQNAAKEYKDKVFLRYEENDVVYQVCLLYTSIIPC